MPIYPPSGYGSKEIEAALGLVNPSGYISNFEMWKKQKEVVEQLLKGLMKIINYQPPIKPAPFSEDLISLLQGARLRESELPAKKLMSPLKGESEKVKQMFSPLKESYLRSGPKGEEIVDIPSTVIQSREGIVGESNRLQPSIDYLESLARLVWGK